MLKVTQRLDGVESPCIKDLHHLIPNGQSNFYAWYDSIYVYITLLQFTTASNPLKKKLSRKRKNNSGLILNPNKAGWYTLNIYNTICTQI